MGPAPEAIARESVVMMDPAVSFEPHRRRLFGLAYRMLQARRPGVEIAHTSCRRTSSRNAWHLYLDFELMRSIARRGAIRTQLPLTT